MIVFAWLDYISSACYDAIIPVQARSRAFYLASNNIKEFERSAGLKTEYWATRIQVYNFSIRVFRCLTAN